MMKVCRNSEGLMCHYPVRASGNYLKLMRQYYRYLASIYKKNWVSGPLFKNRKFTVDAGKMWPDCNGRLRYFNLRAVSTLFCDLLRSLMDCKLSVSPSCARSTKPHLLWRLRLTSKQSLDPHGLDNTYNKLGLTLKGFHKGQRQMYKKTHRFQSRWTPARNQSYPRNKQMQPYTRWLSTL